VSRWVEVSAQGQLFEVRCRGLPRRGGGCRGRISGMSAGARHRLLKLGQRLDRSTGCLFVTVTYPDPVPGPGRCHRDLDVFCKRLERRFPDAAIVWVYEIESSGQRDYHPHFHLLIFNLTYLAHVWIERAWAETIGVKGWVWVEWVSVGKGLRYVAKYLSKECQQASLDYVTYLTGGPWTGRMWGVRNRANLPLAELRRVVFVFDRWFFVLKRDARRVYRNPWDKGDNRYAGFSLCFRRNPYRWLDLGKFYQSA
jgi:hypothetical protein